MAPKATDAAYGRRDDALPDVRPQDFHDIARRTGGWTKIMHSGGLRHTFARLEVNDVVRFEQECSIWRANMLTPPVMALTLSPSTTARPKPKAKAPPAGLDVDEADVSAGGATLLVATYDAHLPENQGERPSSHVCRPRHWRPRPSRTHPTLSGSDRGGNTGPTEKRPRADAGDVANAVGRGGDAATRPQTSMRRTTCLNRQKRRGEDALLLHRPGAGFPSGAMLLQRRPSPPTKASAWTMSRHAGSWPTGSREGRRRWWTPAGCPPAPPSGVGG